MDQEPGASNASNSLPRRRFRILFAVARGLALLLGAFTLVNVIGELRNPGFDANLWWIDLRFASRAANRSLMAVTGVCLMAFAIRPQFAPCRGWFLSSILGLLMAVAAANAWTFYQLVSKDAIGSRFPVPLSAVVLLVLGIVVWAIRFRSRFRTAFLLDRVTLAISVAVGAVLFPLAQMFCFGLTDYRRPADVIVVFGCRVNAEGGPSMALADRVRTGVELYHQGLASRLLFSGGPGEGEIHETEAMRRLAVYLGVPNSAIEVDRDGLNTQATVRNLAASEAYDQGSHSRILAVSNFYHLPRIKLCFRRAGYEVWTVPAKESQRLYYQERFMLREVAALWWYYLNPT